MDEANRLEATKRCVDGSENNGVSRPLNGSTLLSLEENMMRRKLKDESNRIVSCGCLAIDKLLGGGFERGNTVGISCGGMEGRILTFNLLASVLTANLRALIASSPPPTKVIIVDSTGSFPLTLFVSILKMRIILENQKSSSQTISVDINESENVNFQLQSCLEMVNISRIFDIEGFWEVLGETENTVENVRVGDFIKSSSFLNIGQEFDNNHEQVDEKVNLISASEILSTGSEQVTLTPSKRSNVADEGIEVLVVDNMTSLISEFLTGREKADG